MDGSDTPVERTPRHEMPQPRFSVPARWQAISRTYRFLGKIHPTEVPIEECEDLARRLEDLETLVATTRRVLEARLKEGREATGEDAEDEVAQATLF